jgi:hypothetical protein
MQQQAAENQRAAGGPAIVALALGVFFLTGCERDAAWDQPFVRGDVVGLEGAVAVVDQQRDELILLTSPRKNELDVERIRIGKNIVSAVPSRDGSLLLVLSRGVSPRLNPGDERPRLSLITGDPEPALVKQYELDDPLQKLVVDPAGEWAVAYSADGAVVNPNELILVHLAEPEELPIPITIRSSGGAPVRFTFTSPLTVPGGGAHRLLVIETERDLSILDLENPEVESTYVPLPSSRSTALARPAQIAFHDDVPGGDVASYIAVRLADDPDVLTLRLVAPARGPSAFSLVNNIVDAGAQPSTIDFVETDSGLRLAALVPGRRTAVLFDPTTSKSETVEFEQPYSGIARVTNLVADRPETGDVALLYSDSAPSIAFWRLAEASSTPYASFDAYPVENRVSRVIDVPGEDFAHLKLLTGQSTTDFFLLDLQSRQSHPMRALNGFTLRLAPDGRRAWAFVPGGERLADLDFDDIHPVSVTAQRPVFDVFDVRRGDGSGRSLLALHTATAGGGSDLAVTLFDALAPDSADTRFVSGLALEGW